MSGFVEADYEELKATVERLVRQVSTLTQRLEQHAEEHAAAEKPKSKKDDK